MIHSVRVEASLLAQWCEFHGVESTLWDSIVLHSYRFIAGMPTNRTSQFEVHEVKQSHCSDVALGLVKELLKLTVLTL